MLPLDVTLLVLAAALMHATWNAIAKSSTSKLLDITTMALAGSVICALGLPFATAMASGLTCAAVGSRARSAA